MVSPSTPTVDSSGSATGPRVGSRSSRRVGDGALRRLPPEASRITSRSAQARCGSRTTTAGRLRVSIRTPDASRDACGSAANPTTPQWRERASSWPSTGRVASRSFLQPAGSCERSRWAPALTGLRHSHSVADRSLRRAAVKPPRHAASPRVRPRLEDETGVSWPAWLSSARARADGGAVEPPDGDRRLAASSHAFCPCTSRGDGAWRGGCGPLRGRCLRLNRDARCPAYGRARAGRSPARGARQPSRAAPYPRAY
jgi:hypothetical protein